MTSYVSLQCGVLSCPVFSNFRCGFCSDDPCSVAFVRNSQCELPAQIVVANLVHRHDRAWVKVFG